MSEGDGSALLSRVRTLSTAVRAVGPSFIIIAVVALAIGLTLSPMGLLTSNLEGLLIAIAVVGAISAAASIVVLGRPLRQYQNAAFELSGPEALNHVLSWLQPPSPSTGRGSLDFTNPQIDREAALSSVMRNLPAAVQSPDSLAPDAQAILARLGCKYAKQAHRGEFLTVCEREVLTTVLASAQSIFEPQQIERLKQENGGTLDTPAPN